jgi:hypothetical protein
MTTKEKEVYKKLFTKEVESRLAEVEELEARYEKDHTLEQLLDDARDHYDSLFNGEDPALEELFNSELEERRDLCDKFIRKADAIRGIKRLEFGSNITDPSGYYDGHIFFDHAKIEENYGGDEGWVLNLYLRGEEVGTISPYDVKDIQPRRTPP